MKNKCFIISVSIALALILSACGYVFMNNADSYQEVCFMYKPSICTVENEQKLLCDIYASCEANNILIEQNNRYITSECVEYLNEQLFSGFRNPMHIGSGGGMGGGWAYWIFSHLFYGIPGHFVAIVGDDAFEQWVEPVSTTYRQRNASGGEVARSFNMYTFIAHFNISMHQFIQMQEYLWGMPMYEIDERVHWGRNFNHAVNSDFTESTSAMIWAGRFSMKDIEALFSNDVNLLWAAFPGYGILYNNRAYSPEWILNNVERAVLEEGLPIDEIERVIKTASSYGSAEFWAPVMEEFNEIVAVR